MKPWLLIDIDGVLNPMWGTRKLASEGLQYTRVPTRSGTFNVIVVPWHAEAIMSMEDHFRLGWATWWMHEANEAFRTHYGFPAFPVAEFMRFADGFTKVDGILRLVGDEPFVWLDDDVSAYEKNRLATEHPNHKIIAIDPMVGLEQHHLDEARAWAEDL